MYLGVNCLKTVLCSGVHLSHRCHPGYGMMTDGTTTFVNASACTVNFLPMNPPIVIDLPNPRTTWLEEAHPKTPTANKERGARRGRWTRGAQQPNSVNTTRVCFYGTCVANARPNEGQTFPQAIGSFFVSSPQHWVQKQTNGRTNRTFLCPL